VTRARLHTAVPVLASLDIAATVDFYTKSLGFACRHRSPGEYAIVERDGIEIHFWPCGDPRVAVNTGCRVGVEGIAALFEEYSALRALRSDCAVRATPWGTREFEVVDPHGNLITFYEESGAAVRDAGDAAGAQVP